MTTLTMDMLREAMRKVENPPPVVESIRCGSLDRFQHAMTDTDCPLVAVSDTAHFWAGVQVIEIGALPSGQIVMTYTDRSIKIIDLDQEETN